MIRDQQPANPLGRRLLIGLLWLLLVAASIDLVVRPGDFIAHDGPGDVPPRQ